MAKELLEVQHKNLSNLIKECDLEQLQAMEQEFVVKYTFDAISMEGKNTISLEDVNRLINAKALPKYTEREQKEVLNHVKAYDLIKQWIEQKIVLDEERLKDLHEVLVEDIFQGGVYRNVNIQIKGATHQPPDYVKVYDRMNKLFQKIDNVEGDAVEKAVYIHASFAKIHPFFDGNGRLARLLLNYYLIKEDYLPISIPLAKRDEYFDRLEHFKVEKDTTPLVDFVKELLVEQYEKVINKLEVSA
ncbi:MAG: Fic family protein [Acholeplasmataceae bacterium]